jgi:hypothetical protein
MSLECALRNTGGSISLYNLLGDLRGALDLNLSENMWTHEHRDLWK